MRPFSAALRLVLAALIAGLLCVPSAGAQTRHHPRGATAATPAIPFGFVGMNVDGPLLGAGVNLAPVFDRMEASGVQSVRTTFNWAAAQPVAGGPFDFSQSDRIVSLAAARGMTVLPIVMYCPPWAALTPRDPGTLDVPADPAPYAAYAAALVHRYGPQGSFWATHRRLSRLPIERWQIWNEPSFDYYWPQPFAPSYVPLLAAAHAAIKAADPAAQVVLPGFPDLAWQFLATIYQQGGGVQHDFDVVAAHPYTNLPANVVRFLGLMRTVMRRYHDPNKPIMITETGWNSSVGHNPSDDFCCQTTAAGQAADIRALMPILARHHIAQRLLAFYFYTWAGAEQDGTFSFNFAGLFDDALGRLTPKPSYAAFTTGALALERCRRLGPLAGHCVQPVR
jgi:arabinogalactan endo-1,4-beta-galactosidase